MAGEQSAMTTAIGNMETALTDLATAHGAYLTALATVRNAKTGEPAQRTLEAQVGGAIVNRLVRLRLNALGLGTVLHRTGQFDTVTASWATDLAAKVQAVVA
jgi:hypothetical protein